jgi:hypothetical protein
MNELDQIRCRIRKFCAFQKIGAFRFPAHTRPIQTTGFTMSQPSSIADIKTPTFTAIH